MSLDATLKMKTLKKWRPRKGRGANNVSVTQTEEQTVTQESLKDKGEQSLQCSGFSERGAPEKWAGYGYGNYKVFAKYYNMG